MTERLSSRRSSIALLAGSLFDFLGPLVRRGTSDLAPMEWAVCPDCGGEGVRRDRFRRESVCVTCGGREQELDVSGKVVVRARRGKGRVKIDPMDRERRPIGSVETPDAPARIVTALCDECGGAGAHGNGRRCGTCDGSGRRSWSPFVLRVDDEPGAGDVGGAWLNAIVRRDDAGDYARLERALSELLQADVTDGTRLHRLWTARYVLGGNGALAPVDADRLEQAWVFIEARMPSSVKVPADIRRSERARRKHLETVRGRWADPTVLGKRNAEIRRRFASGDASVEELIRTFGVARATVYEAIHSDERRAG